MWPGLHLRDPQLQVGQPVLVRYMVQPNIEGRVVAGPLPPLRNGFGSVATWQRDQGETWVLIAQEMPEYPGEPPMVFEALRSEVYPL